MQIHLELVLGIVGNATAMALFLSPTPTFIRIFKMKSTKEYSSLPYVCTLFNCSLWVLYGLPFVRPHSTMILSINCFGVALEMVYLAVFLSFAIKNIKMQTTTYLIGVLVVYIAIILTTLFAIHTLKLRQLAVGSMCVVMAIAMYAAPLSVMGLVIRTRSVEYMPFALSLCNFMNGAIWTAYSLVTKDIFVGIPNGIGTISGIVQLSMYVIYRNATPVKIEQGGKEERLTTANGNGTHNYISMGRGIEEIKQPGPRFKPLSPLRISSQQAPKPLSNCDVLAAQL